MVFFRSLTRWMLSAILGLLLASCRAQVHPTPTYTGTPETPSATFTHLPSMTPSATPMSTVTRTNTPTIAASPTFKATPTATLRPTPTRTSTPDARLNVNCLEITSKPPSGAQSGGMLVLSGGYYKFSYLVNMKTGLKIPLSQKKGASAPSVAVSPDRKWVAYKEYDASASTDAVSLVVLSADGQTRKVLLWENDWRWIVDWLDGNHLLITRARREFDLDSLILLDPFTGERKELLPDYPDIHNWYPNSDWQGYSRSETVYDSTLTHVVYPRLDEIVLRDLEIGKDLAIFPI